MLGFAPRCLRCRAAEREWEALGFNQETGESHLPAGFRALITRSSAFTEEVNYVTVSWGRDVLR